MVRRLLYLSRFRVLGASSGCEGVQNTVCLATTICSMADLYSKLFQGQLADTIAWCRIQASVMDVRSDQVRRRQASYSFAEQQWNEAIEIMNQRGLRSVAGLKQYQQAVALLKEIRDLLGPMDRKLRSPELTPSFSFDRLENDTRWAEAVKDVVTLRAGLVGGLVDEQSISAAGGRFLLYTPSDNLACGAASANSNGFFDTNNVPPWDLWLAFLNGTLVTWVPPALVDVAAMGIFVNPEACIRWADSH